MNGWISILFSLMGGLALLMKNKTSENGGGDFTVVRDGDSTTPSHSGDEMSNKDISVLDVVDDPSLLNVLKIADPDKYEEITQTIWKNPSYLHKYIRQTRYYTGNYFADIEDKESEVLKLLEEGFHTEYVGRSLSGDYYIEVFTKSDPNVGWNSKDEKVGITVFEMILHFSEEDSPRMMRDYELADAKSHYWNHYVQEFNNEYASL